MKRLPGLLLALLAVLAVGGLLFFDRIDSSLASQATREARAKELEAQRMAAAFAIVDKNTAAELDVREQLEAKQREEAALKALRRSNPDEYLKKLRATDLHKFVEEAKVLRPKVYAAYQEEMRKLSEANEATIQRTRPADYVTAEMSWRKGGFDNVALVIVTLKSTLHFEVRDIVITCDGYGNSGTKIWERETTIYEVLKAKSTRRMPEINMGIIPLQMNQAGCKVVRVKA
jgi:hypothetical protein